VCGRKVWRRSGGVDYRYSTVSTRAAMDALRTLFLVSSIQEAYGRYPGLCCGLLRPTMGWSPLHFLPHPSLPPHLFLRRFGEGTKLFSLTTGTQFLTYGYHRARYVCPSIIQNDAVRSAVPKQSASSMLPYSHQNHHITLLEYILCDTNQQPANKCTKIHRHTGINIATCTFRPLALILTVLYEYHFSPRLPLYLYRYFPSSHSLNHLPVLTAASSLSKVAACLPIVMYDMCELYAPYCTHKPSSIA